MGYVDSTSWADPKYKIFLSRTQSASKFDIFAKNSKIGVYKPQFDTKIEIVVNQLIGY